MESEDLDPYDVVAYITEELIGRYRNAKDAAAQAQVMQDFLRRWEADTALEPAKKQTFEFESDLDWFNVSQPLTLASLKGKLVILDFFTYCCINCMHVLPDLHALEQLYPVEHGLVVIGVHSPKFSNEKDAANIRAAALRYDITHPIVNDPLMLLWRTFNIRCWPTLMVLSPSGTPILMLMGEGHGPFLERFVGEALRFFGQHNELKNFAIPLKQSLDYCPKLRFPAKIARSEEGSFAIADAGNHRILIVNILGQVLYKIGSGVPGLADGNLLVARFKFPQGVVFLNNDVLVVADTENHALRQVTLSTGLVETLAGTGYQGHDRVGGKIGPLQDISSPWDVAVYRTRDMDMSFHMDEQNVHEKTIILISMAGTHQIWGYFPEGMIWWKFRKFEPRTCVSLIGNGSEENRNNSYPQNAAFAQPSGLAMSKDYLFIADSESSSIRKASMLDGKVVGVVGADRNPQNLFAFGDVDGKQCNAKLQHPLAVAYNHVNGKVYVADTFNHKIKVIDPASNVIETLPITASDGVTPYRFIEPSGLCVDKNGQHLLVSDTNNHLLVSVDLQTLKISWFPLTFNDQKENSVPDGPINKLELVKHVPLSRYKQLKLLLTIVLEEPLKFTAEAPQKWFLNNASCALKALQSKGSLENGKLLLLFQRIDAGKVHVPKEALKLQISLSLCDDKCCLMKRFTVVLEEEEEEESQANATADQTDNLANEHCFVQVNITANELSIS